MINRLNRFDFNRVFPRPISSGGGGAPAVNPLHSIGALTRISRGERPIAAANGTYGPYEVVGGLLRPRVSPVTPGFYDVGGIMINAEPDTFDCGTGELAEIMALGSATLSGKTIKILPAAQANGTAVKSTTTLLQTFALTSPMTVTSRDPANPGRMRRLATQHSGVLTFENVLFYDEWQDDGGGSGGIISCGTNASGTPVVSDLRIINCEVSSLSHTTWDFSPAPVTSVVVGELYAPASITTADWSAFFRRGNSAGTLVTSAVLGDLYYCIAAGDISALGTVYPAVRSLYGITCSSAGANQARKLTVTDSHIHDLTQGIAGVGGGWAEFTLARSALEYTFGDKVGVGYSGTEGVWIAEDNWFGATVSDPADVFNAHSDDFQINQDFMTQTAVSPVYFRRNRHWNKDGTGPSQCFFAATQFYATIPYTMDIRVEDNLILSGQASAIVNTLHGPGSVIQRNTVIYDTNPGPGMAGNIPKISVGVGKGQALNIRDNLHCGIIGDVVAEALTFATMVNNQQLASFNDAGADDYLVGTSFNGNAFASLDAFTAAMLSKGGTSIDSAFPKIGAGQYCTYGVSNLNTKSGLGAGVTTAPVATVPAAMTAGMWLAEVKDGALDISVTDLPADGGSTITSIQYRLNGGSWVASGIRHRTLFTIPSLTNGTAYDVELRAVNTVGGGPASDVKNRTPTSLYSITATEFGSGEYILHNTGFSAAGSKTALVAVTFQCPGAVRTSSKLVAFLNGSNVDRMSLQFASSGRLTFYAYDSAGTAIATLLCATGTIVADTWYTVVYSLDTTQTTNAARLKGWIRPAGGSWSDMTIGAGIYSSTQDGIIGDSVRCWMNYTHTASVYYSDVWASTNQMLDVGVLANRDKFLPAVSRGVNGEIPTGTSPQLFLNGVSGSYHVNKGTAGPLALTGTLSAAPNLPS